MALTEEQANFEKYLHNYTSLLIRVHQVWLDGLISEDEMKNRMVKFSKVFTESIEY